MKITTQGIKISETVKTHLVEAAKNVTVKVVELKNEERGDLFVLWYAFYKDDAYRRRKKIPIYRDCLTELEKEKTRSYLLFAYGQNVPVASMWLVRAEDTLLSRGSGSIKEGYKLFADQVLLEKAIQLAKELNLSLFELESTSAFRAIIR